MLYALLPRARPRYILRYPRRRASSKPRVGLGHPRHRSVLLHPSRCNPACAQLDHKLQAKRSGDTPESIKTRGTASCFETCNRRLRTGNSGRQLRLRDAEALARLAHPFRQFEGFLGLPIANTTFFAVGLRAFDACPAVSSLSSSVTCFSSIHRCMALYARSISARSCRRCLRKTVSRMIRRPAAMKYDTRTAWRRGPR